MFRHLVLITILALPHSVLAYSYTMEITEQALQDRISSMMPMERKLLVVSVIISEPTVSLIKESNKIAVFTHIAVVAPDGAKGTGRVRFSGNLNYHPSQGAFYFHNTIIEELEIDNLPTQYAADVKLITQLAVTNAMAMYPVYKLQDNDLRQKYLKSTLESVKVESGKLLVTLKSF